MSNPALTRETVALPEAFQTGLNERIEGGKIDLPLLPNVVMEVMQLSSSENADARKIADMLHRDQTLAGHVLRLANSPAYKPKMPIVSLQQAVSRLGLTQLCEIAYTVSVKGQVFKGKGYEQDVRFLWQHAVGAAVYAKELARMLDYDLDKAFLWGLLHDVGKPVVLLTLTELQKELDIRLERDVVLAAMDAYHAQVGGMLADRWSLPTMVKESILYHHNYFSAPTCVEAAMVTCLADQLSYHLLAPEEVPADSIRDDRVVSHLRCSAENLAALLDKGDEIMQVVETMST